MSGTDDQIKSMPIEAFYEADPNYIDPNNIPVTVTDLITDSRELRVHSVADPSKYFTLYYRPGNYSLDMYKQAQHLQDTNQLDLQSGTDHLRQLVDSWDLMEWVDKTPEEIDPAAPEATPVQRLHKYKKLATVPITADGLSRQGIEAIGMILMRIMLDIRGRREEAQLGKGSPTPSEVDLGDDTNVVPMADFTKPTRTTRTATRTTTPPGPAAPPRRRTAAPRSKSGSR